jgi:hypothetical protein
MDPPPDYVGASQLVPESNYSTGYQQVVPSVIYNPLQPFFDFVSKAFVISFKNNERKVKNPNQLIVDDTLHCMPNKLICLYLGQRIVPLDGHSPPRVHIFLKYSDDKDKNKKVVACSKHRSNTPDVFHMIQSDNLGVIYEDTDRACVLSFAYPQVNGPDDVPSISFRFVCSSSCLQRAKFELHVELVFPDLNNGLYVFNHKHLVKVSSNPGRDAGQQTFVSQFARAKSAFTPSAQKPRARKSDSESGPSSKRAVSGAEQVESEKTNNDVYMLPVFGLKDYQKMINHYNLLLTRDKYELKKCSGNPGVFNSQIPASSELTTWLETCNMKKYKDAFKANGIRKMDDIYRAYDSHIFEKLGVSLDDAKILHCSFIFWRTSYVSKIFEDAENTME